MTVAEGHGAQGPPLFRFRFKANHDDSRPVIFPPPLPWWESGVSGDDDDPYAIVVAYGESEEYIRSFWPEASEIDVLEECAEIVFTSRFRRPTWWQDDGRFPVRVLP